LDTAPAVDNILSAHTIAPFDDAGGHQCTSGLSHYGDVGSTKVIKRMGCSDDRLCDRWTWDLWQLNGNGLSRLTWMLTEDIMMIQRISLPRVPSCNNCNCLHSIHQLKSINKMNRILKSFCLVAVLTAASAQASTGSLLSYRTRAWALDGPGPLSLQLFRREAATPMENSYDSPEEFNLLLLGISEKK
jgi:hypothetical protein